VKPDLKLEKLTRLGVRDLDFLTSTVYENTVDKFLDWPGICLFWNRVASSVVILFPKIFVINCSEIASVVGFAGGA
jgi:hypothetical protein